MIDDTIIVFLSDNGGEEENGADNKPYRGGKGTESAYEAGMRVPALVWWKNSRIEPGLVIRTPVHAVDLTATLLALAGAKSALPLDGQNLWKYLTGRKEVEARELPLVISPKRQVVRYGDWKLIQGVATASITTSSGTPTKTGKMKVTQKRETTAVTPGSEPGKKTKAGKTKGSGEGSGPGSGEEGKAAKTSKAKTPAKAKVPAKAKTAKAKASETTDSGTTVEGTGGGDAGSDIELFDETLDGGGDAGSDGFDLSDRYTNDLAQSTSKSSKRKSRTSTTSSGSGSGSGSGSSSSTEKIVIELYDLSIDPAESVNLATKRADKLKELQEIASKYLADSVAPFADITLSPEAAPITAPGWKYPAIVGVFGPQAETGNGSPATAPAAGSGSGATP
jgi:hypothetical protein